MRAARSRSREINTFLIKVCAAKMSLFFPLKIFFLQHKVSALQQQQQQKEEEEFKKKAHRRQQTSQGQNLICAQLQSLGCDSQNIEKRSEKVKGRGVSVRL